MKILAIGDFHGEWDKKWERLIKKEKIDLVISNGDYFPFDYRDLWFKHCYGKDCELWEVIGKKKMREFLLKDLNKGEKAIARLNSLKVPVFSVIGNLDHGNYNDTHNTKKIKKGKSWKWAEQDFFKKLIKKYRNIMMIDYKAVRFGEFVFIGARGGTNPGHVKSKIYKKHKEILNRLFRRYNKEKVIFISHNVPYNTKLDKISMKAHLKVRGKHYGSKLIRRAIDKWEPILHIGGHIHEGRGRDKLGKTVCVNPGAAHDGKAAVVEILNNGRMNVRFIS